MQFHCDCSHTLLLNRTDRQHTQIARKSLISLGKQINGEKFLVDVVPIFSFADSNVIVYRYLTSLLMIRLMENRQSQVIRPPIYYANQVPHTK